MTPPTAEQKRAYDWARTMPPDTFPPDSAEKVLADDLRDTRAELMESEFNREHRVTWLLVAEVEHCKKCLLQDPRHKYTPEQWRRAADKLYREG